MKHEDMVCGQCGQVFRMLAKEKKRQVNKGRTIFFCGLACAAVYHNTRRHVKLPPETRTCAECGASFCVDSADSPKRFCSRSCASRGSVTATRRAAARAAGKATSVHNFKNGYRTDVLLRKREHWKYEQLEKFLSERNIAHIFEYSVGDYIYDLALTELKCLVEFDGPYHRAAKQRERDAAKDIAAATLGWTVMRITVPQGAVIMISAALLKSL